MFTFKVVRIDNWYPPIHVSALRKIQRLPSKYLTSKYFAIGFSKVTPVFFNYLYLSQLLLRKSSYFEGG